ncbi:putative Ig domain-containing protein [Curtobacterium citreum]|uniref:Ig domain-containing protein n=1 Tax=Curtobacterium citreum TaxID=2036 RepID=A0ABU8Y6N6_9MICO
MSQPCTSTTRRVAAIGAAVAIVAASSALGIGATTAVAAEEPTATSTVTPAATSAATPAASASPETPVPTDTPDEQPGGPTTDPTPAPADESETPLPAAPAADDGSDLAFTEPSTADAPLVLTATAGTPFSHSFETTGGNGTVGYAIQDAPSSAAGPSDYSVNVETGVLSGTPTDAGTFRFEVVALSGSTQITEHVELTVSPAAEPDVITFDEQSKPESPIRIETTAGDTVDRTFTATGSSSELHYILLSGPTAFPVPGNAYPTAPAGLSVDEATGRLSGAPTQAGEWDFQVMAMNGARAATQYVHLSIRPAATAHLELLIGVIGTGQAWQAGEHGLREIFAESPDANPVDAVPAAQGATMSVRVTPLDAYGNPTEDHDGTTPTVTSSVSSDEVSFPSDPWNARVGFPHASPHTITVALDGVSTSFDVDVQPAAATIGTTTPTVGSGTGTLAYTGAETSGPLAWALALLGIGGGLLVHRLRRRRA